MQVDLSQLLVWLAERAKVHQDQLQGYLRRGTEQIGRSLGSGGPRFDLGYDPEKEGVDWIIRAQDHRARLDEVQRVIEAITRMAANSASAGKTAP